jgi:SAM-dependent methyltransferase
LGIDPSPSCVETVKNRYQIPSKTGTISDLSSILPGSVELLILVGVLEHIQDLDWSIKELRKILKPGGKICIVVPDASQYFNGKDAPFQEFSIEHINFFGPRSLTNLMVKHMFTESSSVQQIFEVNYNTLTPVILSIYTKEKTESSFMNFDDETGTNLKMYISQCDEEQKSIESVIKKIIRVKEPVIIWGTGAQTLRLLSTTDMKNADIICFVDSNPKYQGNKLNNIPVISPDELKNRKEQILISTRAYQHEIEFQIRKTLKLPNKIIKLFK